MREVLLLSHVSLVSAAMHTETSCCKWPDVDGTVSKDERSFSSGTTRPRSDRVFFFFFFQSTKEKHNTPKTYSGTFCTNMIPR